MSLNAGLNMAIRGMMTTALKTNLSSQNITNADKTGYSRKSLDVSYITTNTGSTPVEGMIVGATDKFLLQALVDDISKYQKDSTISDSLDYYSTQLGNTDGSNSLSKYLDNMYSTLQYLATNPETDANKSEVVQTAVSMTSSLRDLSNDIQKLRTEAEQKIAVSVSNINATLDRIDELNDKVSSGTNGDASLAEYEDQRAMEIQNLSSELGIQYFSTSSNRVQIYTQSGQPLLLTEPHHIDYSQTTNIHGSTVYPAGFSSMNLNGVDITTKITGGRLAGNIELRDQIYVAEQAKLDEFTTVLKEHVNSLLNDGASIPSRAATDGSRQSLTAATPFTATGSIRVAIIDRAGIVQSYSDINLGAMTTINNVLTALNGMAGVTASLNTSGELSISVLPNTNGIAINPLNSAVTSSTGQSFSHYFGLNDMFVGSGAEDIQVSDYLSSNPAYLAVSVLSSSGSLAAGDRGVNRGDGSIANSLADALSNNVNFAAAGDFTAQSNTLQRYAQAFISSAASKADISEKESNTSYQVFKTGSDLLTSTTGVNVDEETAKLLLLQNQYQAGAQIVKTIQNMLDALIAAMR